MKLTNKLQLQTITKQIFTNEKMNVRLVRKGNTIRQYLNRSTEQVTCQLHNCPIQHSGICLRKNVIYEIQCNICKNIYVGSTIRFLHTRVKEHLTNKSSSMYKHLQSCDVSNTTNVSVKILASDEDNCNIRLREAMYIKKLKASINSKEELFALSEFLYL